MGLGDISEEEAAPPVRNILSVRFATLWFPSENLAALLLIVWKMKDDCFLVTTSTALTLSLTHSPLSKMSKLPMQYSRK